MKYSLAKKYAYGNIDNSISGKECCHKVGVFHFYVFISINVLTSATSYFIANQQLTSTVASALKKK